MSDMYKAEKQARTINEWLDILSYEIGRLDDVLTEATGEEVGSGGAAFQDRTNASFDDLVTRAAVELEKAVAAIQLHQEVLRILKAKL